MNPAPEKKKVNIGLFLLMATLATLLIGSFAMKTISSRPDYTVAKKKITRAQLEEFKGEVKRMVSKYTVRHEGKLAIVHPPADSDIYLLGRNYTWGKYILELEQNQPYRLHLASQDMPHALIVQELRLMNRIRLGQFTTVSFSPHRAGRFKMQCGDFCGIGHYGMVGAIIVTASDFATSGR